MGHAVSPRFSHAGGGGSGPRPSTFVIAPSNASAKSKAGADLVLPGANDQTAIAGLVSSATSSVGLLILEGLVVCSGPIVPGANWLVRGLGLATTIQSTGLAISPAVGKFNVTIADLALNAPQGILTRGDDIVYNVTMNNCTNGTALILGSDSVADMVTVFGSAANCKGLQTNGDCTVSNSTFFSSSVGLTISGNDQITGCTFFSGSPGVSSAIVDGAGGAALITGCVLSGPTNVSSDLMTATLADTAFFSNRIYFGPNINIRGNKNLVLGNTFMGNAGATITDLGTGTIWSYTGGAVGSNYRTP